ncbi:MAG: LPS export ABC transporter permease LptF [Aeromonadaceae bacterium]
MILSRYIFKETLKTQLAVLGILLLIFLSQSFIRILSRAARGAIPTQLVSEMLLLNIPSMAMLMLPISLFIAVLFAHGRLHAESEMTVMRAVGMGPGSAMMATQVLACLTMLVALFNAMWLAPWAEEQQYRVLDKVKADPGFFALDSGRFMNLDGGKVVAYIDRLDGKSEKKLTRIYILQQGSSTQAPSVVVSDSGSIKSDETGLQWLTLNDGKRYEGPSEKGEFKISQFAEYRTWIQDKEGVTTERRGVSALYLPALLASKDPKAVAEWQWRVALPLSIPILTLIVVPMAVVNPRQGRYAKLLPAILLYLSYFLLLSAGKSALERGDLPAMPGLYLVPMIFLLFFALPLNLSDTRWRNRLRLRIKGSRA